MMNLRTIQNTLFLILATVLFAACGGKPDPTAKHQSLVDDSTKEKRKEKSQQIYIDTKMVKIIPDSDINFVEGQESRFTITASILAPGVDYDLVPINFPCQNCLNRVDNNTWEVVWTPPKSTVTGTLETRIFETQVRLDYTKVDSHVTADTLARIKGTDRTLDLPIRVTPHNVKPEISISEVPKVIQQGQSVEFHVDVFDPDFDAGNPTELYLVKKPAKTNEIDGSYLVISLGFKQIDEDTRRYKYKIVTDGDNKERILIDLNQDQVSAAYRLALKAYNPANSTATADQPIEFDIQVEAASPIIEVQDDNKGKVKSEQQVSIKLRIKSQDKRSKSKLDIDAARKSLAALPGDPSIECKTKDRGQECEIKWDVPCVNKKVKEAVALSAMGFLGNESSPTSQSVTKITKNFTITKSKKCSGEKK